MRPEEFQEAVEQAATVLAAHLRDMQAGHGPVVSRKSPDQLRELMSLAGWITRGGMTPQTLGSFLETYLQEGTRLHHPGYMAHQCGVPSTGAAIADLVHGVTNNAMSLHEMGAAAVAAELEVVQWMLSKIGWSEPESGGVLVHGGSLANLTALHAARARAFPGAEEHGNPPSPVILAPPGAHVSVARAASIMGLGTHAVHPLPVDELGRVRPPIAAATMDTHRHAGSNILAVVVNSCAPATGLYDPLREIADHCRERDVWLHVDAAHGGSALLDPNLREHLDGIALADSVTWDAHKMLRTSTLAAGLLMRSRQDLDGLPGLKADYLFYGTRPGPDLMAHTIEGSKAELGLKVFLSLAWHGESGLARYVRDCHHNALFLWDLLADRDGFEVLTKPDFNIVCFRHRGSDADQVTIRDRLMDDGTFHLASSVIGGKRWLRATLISPNTDTATLTQMIHAVEQAGASSPPVRHDARP
ncbi:pyridoxal phosphate-dependent decarboxylase family protein [Actinomadura macrotermitis]|uniref:L-2,4-diaminobutyrate decarboxylase n=1 Tax=Actinomadura macrotermitis TaxID=2585200 RepID=A0A7K0C056_9ACTN|nr:pyridoxal-dependent decarboxylase [Actinomadura macrotermitis]MQY06811.1 L-2,4-diaminobutyrate decarboxylase [Actinomadura macrotermitis]